MLASHDLPLASGWYSEELADRSAAEEIEAVAHHAGPLHAMDCRVMVYATGDALAQSLEQMKKPTRAALLDTVFNMHKWDNPLLLGGIKLNAKAGADISPIEALQPTSSTARNMFRLASSWISKARRKNSQADQHGSIGGSRPGPPMGRACTSLLRPCNRWIIVRWDHTRSHSDELPPALKPAAETNGVHNVFDLA
ncbi:hypothetical protein RFN28_26790 [Mesorhizobium sp. VK24D]|uniref:Uncharacterized protein n=1 Tax=Mesorhizobium album TaxID=3072314 RepID=A0ABU4Y520_9HYPH|nr:hypothetical protein [Mesorhizobium sp. VK24D]MDX8482042.1 hypothetical protein [Mesorhizobium sp. VK24D]